MQQLLLLVSDVLYLSPWSGIEHTLVVLTASLQCCRQCGRYRMLSSCGSGRLAVVASRGSSEGGLGAAGQSGERCVGTALRGSLSAIGRDGGGLGRSIWGRCESLPQPLGSLVLDNRYDALGTVAALHGRTGKVDLVRTDGGEYGVGVVWHTSSYPGATHRKREHSSCLWDNWRAEWLHLPATVAFPRKRLADSPWSLSAACSPFMRLAAGM